MLVKFSCKKNKNVLITSTTILLGTSNKWPHIVPKMCSWRSFRGRPENVLGMSPINLPRTSLGRQFGMSLGWSNGIFRDVFETLEGDVLGPIFAGWDVSFWEKIESYGFAYFTSKIIQKKRLVFVKVLQKTSSEASTFVEIFPDFPEPLFSKHLWLQELFPKTSL